MQIQLVAGQAARTIAATGQLAEPGQPVDVDDDLAADLLEQTDVWQATKKTTSKNKSATAQDGEN